MKYNEVVKILKENNVDFEFIEKLYDGCNVYHIYAEDDVPVWANEEGFRKVEEDALVPDVDDYIRQEEEK